jgi:hypothetical protein
VRSKNLARRDLSEAQRVAAVLKLEQPLDRYRGEARAAQGARSDRRLPETNVPNRRTCSPDWPGLANVSR